MVRVTVTELAGTVEQLRAQVAELAKRLEALQAPPKLAAAVPVKAETPEPPRQPVITEEELLAISAALGAYLGVRPHIRQIRLVSTPVWAQQGRVSIQASHRLQG
jgi:methylmalonyl-CoA carboxyltransferase large subunit